MGTCGPKSPGGDDVEETSRYEDLLADIEEAVEEAILSGQTKDHVLASLLEVTIISTRDGRPLFPNPLDEPILYRQFQRMVASALGEADKVEDERQQAIKKFSGGG
jgi:hypothetical protein